MGSMSEIVSSALSFIDSGDILYTLRICNLNERCAGISYSTTIDAKARARANSFFFICFRNGGNLTILTIHGRQMRCDLVVIALRLFTITVFE